jgi:hypothetical protein
MLLQRSSPTATNCDPAQITFSNDLSRNVFPHAKQPVVRTTAQFVPSVVRNATASKRRALLPTATNDEPDQATL